MPSTDGMSTELMSTAAHSTIARSSHALASQRMPLVGDWRTIFDRALLLTLGEASVRLSVSCAQR